jgi:hypothetical protein
MLYRGLSPHRPHVLRTTIVVGIVVLGIMVTATAQVTVDPALSSYQRVSGVSGNLNSMGSDTLNNLMTLWEHVPRSAPLHLCQRRLGLREPKRHVHGTIHLDRCPWRLRFFSRGVQWRRGCGVPCRADVYQGLPRL